MWLAGINGRSGSFRRIGGRGSHTRESAGEENPGENAAQRPRCGAVRKKNPFHENPFHKVLRVCNFWRIIRQ